MTAATVNDADGFRYPITGDNRSAFWRDGHILLRSIVTADYISKYRPAIAAATAQCSIETRKLAERDTYTKAFLQVTNLWRHDEKVRQFVFEKSFAQIAADLLGVEKVRLYHDQALFKEPLGGPTPWHQDKYYWPLDTDKAVTMWMPLGDIDEQMGMLKFASGSHKLDSVGSFEISDESDAEFRNYIGEREFPIAGTISMSAGDATFHLSGTIHSAGPNKSPDKTREVMTVIYFADGAKVTEPENEHQAADLQAWLGGRSPGERANSDLNPILN